MMDDDGDAMQQNTRQDRHADGAAGRPGYAATSGRLNF